MLYINLNRESSVSMSKQIYTFFRNNILNGLFVKDEKLPSTRELANDIKVSRNVVIEAYEQLIAEGYLYSKNGAGTYVNDGVFFETLLKEDLIEKKPVEKLERNIISFRTGVPDLRLIPIKHWGKIYKDITLSLSPEYLGYQNSSGEYILQYELAKYLRRVRGVNCRPENIIITTGAAQAFSLLCQLVSEHEYALVENPLSYGILNTLHNKNVKIKTIPVDKDGMVTSNLPHISPKLIFTTPSHQFPTGVVLPIKRRIELIKYARKYNSFIIEDDYDSEFRFSGSPIQSMQALDKDHVIYVGTFSKTFMPSLRMGYMILPDCLIDKMNQIKYIDDLHCPVLEQLTMAEFIKKGFLDLHIKKMKAIYLKKRNILIKCLNEVFVDNVSIMGEKAGMHLVASFKGVNFNDDLMRKIYDNHIEIAPVNKHYINCAENQYNYEDCLIFGYGNTPENLIEEGVKRIYNVLKLHI